MDEDEVVSDEIEPVDADTHEVVGYLYEHGFYEESYTE